LHFVVVQLVLLLLPLQHVKNLKHLKPNINLKNRKPENNTVFLLLYV
jgi:hypothetical protein